MVIFKRIDDRQQIYVIYQHQNYGFTEKQTTLILINENKNYIMEVTNQQFRDHVMDTTILQFLFKQPYTIK
ncbi:unnamed protein product [Paramecium octaurelia]|uniref:Uncharacterized protein n=1 Tax=Paramecium octaurelia TaxID=43137 RepID=A0A8S1S4Y4_PAROT|nr:unnamed protein product [Paramecium octaurelia]